MASFVWSLYKINDPSDSTATCKSCDKQIKRGSSTLGQKSFSTTPLHNHAKKFHSELYEKQKQNNEAGTSGTKPKTNSHMGDMPPIEKKMKVMKKQLSLEESFSSKQIWNINDSKSINIHRKIALMMALDNQPFSITEDEGFIGLIAQLQPRYLIPSLRYFSEKAIPKLYDELHQTVNDDIEKSEHISFTSDIWTCPSSHETFISLSGHWIKDSFEHKDAVLHASHFSESHTGINIAEKFKIMLEGWKINASRRHILVRDGAANMALASELAQITSVYCTIHLLQLVIKDAILSQRVVKDVLANARRIATHFNHSSLGCSEFKSIQKDTEFNKTSATPLLLVQDVPTRWNSSYLMLERLNRLKRAVQIYLADHNELPNFTSNEWKIIETLLHILKPFYQLTVEMSSEFCTLSTVIPNIMTLQRFLTKTGDKDRGVLTTKHELLSSLNKRFFSEDKLNILDDPRYVLSTVIDPRYKLKFLPSDKREQGKSMMLEAVIQNQRKQNEYLMEVNSNSDNSSRESSPKQKKQNESSEDEFSSCFLELVKDQEMPRTVGGNDIQKKDHDSQKKPEQVSLVKAAQEVDNYFSHSIIDRKSSALEYWKNEDRYPMLKSLSRKLLATPASSVFSERMYSEYGNIFENKRSRLLPQQGEMLLFIHHNSKKFLDN